MGIVGAQEPVREAPASEQLGGELQALTFEYALGSRLHRAHLTAPETLAKLSAAFRIVAQSESAPEPIDAQVLGHRPAMILDLGDRRRHSFHIAGRNQIHGEGWGRLTLDPAFFRGVETWISDIEQSPVFLCVENPFPEDRLERLFEFQALDDRPWQEAEIQGPKRKVLVHGSHAVRDLQVGYRGLYVPSQTTSGESWGYSVGLTSWIGEPIGFTLVDATHCATRPLHAALLRHPTLGTVWVDDGFRDALLELHTPSFPIRDLGGKGSSPGLAQVQAAAQSLVDSPPRFLVYRGVLAGDPNKQHVWSIRGRKLRSELQAHLVPSRLRLHRADHVSLQRAWGQRPLSLGSLTWTDASGSRWTLYQGSSNPAWLPPVAEWEGVESLWPILQEYVR